MRFPWRRAAPARTAADGKAALAAAGAVVMDETGAIVDPAPGDRRDRHESLASFRA